MINDAMGAVMEAQGFKYVKKDAEGNPGNQVQFVEQAIAAGNVGCLMIAAMSVEMLKDVVQQATDNGIAVVYLGAQPTITPSQAASTLLMRSPVCMPFRLRSTG